MRDEDFEFGSPEHIQELEERIQDLTKWRDRQQRGSEKRANYSRLISTLRAELKSAQKASKKLGVNTVSINELKSLIFEIISNKSYITESFTIPTKEENGWSLEDKLEAVHGKNSIGQGSIFSKSAGEVLELVKGRLSKMKRDEIDRIAKTKDATVTFDTGKIIGYNLVLPMEDAKLLPDAEKTTTEKQEGPDKITVPVIKTTAPINNFTTDELTVVVRKMKDSNGNEIDGEYIVLSAWPGEPLEPASQWGGRYAIIVPNASQSTNESNGFTFDKFIDDIVIRENSRNKIKTHSDTPIRDRARNHQEKPGNRIRFR